MKKILLALAISGGAAQADTITPIDLKGFFADPTLTVSTDGSSATFLEEPPFDEVILSNNPGLGASVLFVPAANRKLVFDYDFAEGVGNNDDHLGAVVIRANGLTGAPSIFITSSSSGSVEFDLTALIGETLGLEFTLGSLSNDVDSNSTLTVSNVRLVDPHTTPVPLPAAGWMLLAGVGGLAAAARRRERA